MAVRKSKKRKTTHKKTKAKKGKKRIKKTKKVKKIKAKKVAKPVKKLVPVSSAPAKKLFTKSELQRALAAHVGITKQEVGSTLEALSKIIHNHLRKGGVGLIKIEGLMKIERVHKPAKKARKGINPFTGEEMMFKAKPAHDVVKVRTLKKLKQMVK